MFKLFGIKIGCFKTVVASLETVGNRRALISERIKHCTDQESNAAGETSASGEGRDGLLDVLEFQQKQMKHLNQRLHPLCQTLQTFYMLIKVLFCFVFIFKGLTSTVNGNLGHFLEKCIVSRNASAP